MCADCRTTKKKSGRPFLHTSCAFTHFSKKKKGGKTHNTNILNSAYNLFARVEIKKGEGRKSIQTNGRETFFERRRQTGYVALLVWSVFSRSLCGQISLDFSVLFFLRLGLHFYRLTLQRVFFPHIYLYIFKKNIKKQLLFFFFLHLTSFWTTFFFLHLTYPRIFSELKKKKQQSWLLLGHLLVPPFHPRVILLPLLRQVLLGRTTLLCFARSRLPPRRRLLPTVPVERRLLVPRWSTRTWRGTPWPKNWIRF